MSRATKVLAATTIAGFSLSAYLWLDNRSLREQRDEQAAPNATATGSAQPIIAARTADPWTEPSRTKTAANGGPMPNLPQEKEESRLDKRVRRQNEFAAMFGRLNGETEDEYRARIGPLIKTGLAIPRSRVEDMRKQAEEKAHVTAEQSKKLDKAFDKVYDNVLDYTNKAIADGILSPYDRNVAGWLQYAGGLGTMLEEANGTIGTILTPDQISTLGSSGFEWGEYLGLEAPWERLNPPPPPRH